MAGPSGPAFLYNFYPRSPCGERHVLVQELRVTSNFYPRSPCGERRYPCNALLIYCHISIHALLAESDWQAGYTENPTTYFYPRSPCGERLTGFSPTLEGHKISIHALLAESDVTPMVTPPSYNHFYPRSPCGERPEISRCNQSIIRFLSTLSLRRATIRPPNLSSMSDISIHALLAESDQCKL